MRLALPFRKQHTDYSCGPASLEMALAFLGDKKDEPALIKETHADEIDGTKHKWMIETALREGFYCYAQSHSSINEIKHFLSRALPVIVDYTEPSGNIGHYALVVGYGRGKIILNDPWNGKNFPLSEKDFIDRWHDDLTKSQGWLMVISKEDLHL